MAWGTGARDRTSTAEHKARTARVLERDGHQCQLRGPRCIGHATQNDHIKNVKSFANEADAEHDDNCQAACVPCHMEKTSREGVEARQKRRARLRLPQGVHPGDLIGSSGGGG